MAKVNEHDTLHLVIPQHVRGALVKMLNAIIAEFGSCSVNLVLKEGTLVFNAFPPQAIKQICTMARVGK
jgi:hypothetical protein